MWRAESTGVLAVCAGQAVREEKSCDWRCEANAVEGAAAQTTLKSNRQEKCRRRVSPSSLTALTYFISSISTAIDIFISIMDDEIFVYDSDYI
jgi:hypothetical protein